MRMIYDLSNDPKKNKDGAGLMSFLAGGRRILDIFLNAILCEMQNN